MTEADTTVSIRGMIGSVVIKEVEGQGGGVRVEEDAVAREESIGEEGMALLEGNSQRPRLLPLTLRHHPLDSSHKLPIGNYIKMYVNDVIKGIIFS